MEYDRDITGLNGSPDITQTIFEKIDKQMYMIRHHMPFYNLDPFPFTEISCDLLDIFPQLIVNYFSSVLWCGNNMILAHPFSVC